jgi:ankyrin repeat protein
VNAHSKNKERNTALHLSVIGGHAQVVKLFLQMGAEIDAEDGTNSKYTAMHYAAQRNNISWIV